MHLFSCAHAEAIIITNQETKLNQELWKWCTKTPQEHDIEEENIRRTVKKDIHTKSICNADCISTVLLICLLLLAQLGGENRKLCMPQLPLHQPLFCKISHMIPHYFICISVRIEFSVLPLSFKRNQKKSETLIKELTVEDTVTPQLKITDEPICSSCCLHRDRIESMFLTRFFNRASSDYQRTKSLSVTLNPKTYALSVIAEKEEPIMASSALRAPHHLMW